MVQDQLSLHQIPSLLVSLSSNMEDLTSELNSGMELLQNLSEMIHPLNSHVLDYFPSGVLNNPNHGEGTHQSLFCSFNQTNGPNFGFQQDRRAAQASEFAEASSPPGFGSASGGNDWTDNNSGTSGRKRKRKADGEGEKPKEVIHVRAKRGQATDSHSLAERVRREKINEKLKVLQDLVPGCYKTMGMAVTLDVIISYVRSLQNQIEFLSMKLSAASMFYDFNSPEAEAIEALQRATNSCEAHGFDQRVGRSEEILPRIQSTWPF